MLTRVVLIVMAFGAAAAWFGLRSDVPREGTYGRAHPPAGPPAPPAGVTYRGLAIQMHSGFGSVELYRPQLREIAALGANCVLISTAGYMEHARAQNIFIDARKSPAPADFAQILRDARAMGLRPFLMPIVLLTHPRGSEWRGVIEPPDWKEWWKHYTEFVIYFADIAREGQAEGLLIGSELVSTEKSTAEWVKVIEKARAHAPGVKLGYSANWDHYKPVQFWDKLDFIGMTSYYTLADRENPSIEEVVERWKPVRKAILDWRQTVNKPLFLTEVGWCSQAGAAMNPWNYYANMKATPEGHEEQRRLYEAFLAAWDGAPGLEGVIWWEWDGRPGGPDDYGYSPKGKPAEQVLRRWFAAGKPAGGAGPSAATPAP
jgi:hypothetical protein